MSTKIKKSNFAKSYRGGYILSLTVLGYRIFTISKSFRGYKFVFFLFSAFGLSRSTGVRSKSGFKNITNQKPLKSFTNPPKIIGLPVLHGQLKFYVPQHGHALVPCSCWCGVKSDIKIRFLVPKLVYSPIFRSIRLQIFEKTLFQFRC